MRNFFSRVARDARALLSYRVSKGGSVAILAFALLVCLGSMAGVQGICNTTNFRQSHSVEYHTSGIYVTSENGGDHCDGVWPPDYCQSLAPSYPASCYNTDCTHHHYWDTTYTGTYPFGSCNKNLWTPAAGSSQWFVTTTVGVP